jgi:HD-GYP domain-containing protein (c-di-GMP phosphodiesterase class II)
MTSHRPYRAARTYLTAVDQIVEHAGTQFDPALTRIFERLTINSGNWHNIYSVMSIPHRQAL